MLQRLLSSIAERKANASSIGLVATRGKWKTLQYILALVIFGCLGISLWKNWNDVREYEWHFRYSFLALSFVRRKRKMYEKLTKGEIELLEEGYSQKGYRALCE